MYAYINIYRQRDIKRYKEKQKKQLFINTKKREENEKVYLFDGHGLHPWLLHCL